MLAGLGGPEPAWVEGEVMPELIGALDACLQAPRKERGAYA